jgi:hypothetical protein
MASVGLPLTQYERTKIVKTFVKNALAGLFLSALFLLVLSVPARAQVLAHSGDVAGYAGYLYVSNIDIFVGGSPVSANHGLYGANGGYNITPSITVLGEYGYVPLYSGGGTTLKTQLYGGGVRFNLTPDKKIVPYGVVNVGGDKLSASTVGGSVSLSGYYFGVGGGASYYVGKNWGVRPEFRYVRPEYSFEGVSHSYNSVAVTGGFFYQWGGTGKKKK